MPTPNTRPARTDQPGRVKPSVRTRSSTLVTTSVASGRSSWKRSALNTTNGAVPKIHAAATPAVPPASARPSAYVAAIPAARNKSMTISAAAASVGSSRYTTPAAHGTTGG